MEQQWIEGDTDSDITDITPQTSTRSYDRVRRKAFEENDSGIGMRNSLIDDGSLPSVIPISVGGHYFTTRLSTLRKYPNSMLAAMFSGRHKLDKDVKGNYFIDSDGTYFCHILEFLRHGTLPPADVSLKVYKDARYFNIEELTDKLQLTPYVAQMLVHESHRALFPDYMDFKERVIRIAIENSAIDRCTEVIIHAKQKEKFQIKASYFDVNHDCMISTAHITYGPWDTGTNEDQLVRCLERDLQQEGFHIKPFDQKRRCKYYNGMNCQYCVWRVGFVF